VASIAKVLRVSSFRSLSLHGRGWVVFWAMELTNWEVFVEKGICSTLRGRLLTVSLLIKFINVKCGLDQPTEGVIIPL
jgi:hypothetical protein